MQDVPVQGEVLYLPFDSVWPLWNFYYETQFMKNLR